MDARQTQPRQTLSSTAGDADAWTYRRILDWTQAKLRERGVASPRVEAELLLAHAAGCQRILLYTRLDEPTPEAIRTTMRGLVQRRMQAEPVAYLTGHREFFGLDFEVTSSVLIPRPETETLVMTTLGFLDQNANASQVLEVGVGSGCVAAALAKQNDRVSIVAVDASADALEVASRNIAKHELAERIELRHGESFSALQGETFDVIVSNPPYIRVDEMDGLDPDVRLHEPHVALVGGDDGLDVARTLIDDGPKHLNPGGLLAIELDPAQMPATKRLLETAGWRSVTITQDANGDERVISAVRPSD